MYTFFFKLFFLSQVSQIIIFRFSLICFGRILFWVFNSLKYFLRLSFPFFSDIFDQWFYYNSFITIFPKSCDGFVKVHFTKTRWSASGGHVKLTPVKQEHDAFPAFPKYRNITDLSEVQPAGEARVIFPELGASAQKLSFNKAEPSTLSLHTSTLAPPPPTWIVKA